MGRRFRPWWLALGLSLLLHAVLLGSLRWTLPPPPDPSDSPVFQARLIAVEAPVAAPPAPRRPAPVAKPAEPVHTLASVVPPQAERATEPVIQASVMAEAAVSDAAVSDAAVPIALPPLAEPAPIEAPPPPLNPLPKRVDLLFDVHYGLASGEQTLVWINEGEHYTLTSVAGATGLTGLFYRGRFVQTSHGRITSHGLQPEAFWDQRGDKRSSARFDTAQGQVTLDPAKGEPRHFDFQGSVQDALSLFFQLALTAPPTERQLTYRVFNGKKLRDYRYEVRGEVMLETPLGIMRTLHLARTADSDGRFEAWLAIDRHYLPVRVLRSDEKGNEAELIVRSIAP